MKFALAIATIVAFTNAVKLTNERHGRNLAQHDDDHHDWHTDDDHHDWPAYEDHDHDGQDHHEE